MIHHQNQVVTTSFERCILLLHPLQMLYKKSVREASAALGPRQARFVEEIGSYHIHLVCNARKVDEDNEEPYSNGELTFISGSHCNYRHFPSPHSAARLAKTATNFSVPLVVAYFLPPNTPELSKLFTSPRIQFMMTYLCV